LSVVVAAAAVAAAAAESAFTKLASRLSLSWGWVGVSMDLGGMLPVRTLKSCVTGFRLDTLGWAESDSLSTPCTIARLRKSEDLPHVVRPRLQGRRRGTFRAYRASRSLLAGAFSASESHLGFKV
jgi:hypothetical protein